MPSYKERMLMPSYKGIMFIGDVMLSRTKPGRRMEDDFYSIAEGKLVEALDYARENNLKPVIVGSLVKKSFEIFVYSRLIKILEGRSVLVIASKNEYKGAGSIINDHSSVKLLHDSGIIKLCEESKICEKIKIKTDNNDYIVNIFGCPERDVAPNSFGQYEGIKEDELTVLACKSMSEEESSLNYSEQIERDSFNWPGCDLVVTDKLNEEFNYTNAGNTEWLYTGPLVRTLVEHDELTPKYWIWQPGMKPQEEIPSHERHVFDVEGIASEDVQVAYGSSEFSIMLREQSELAKQNIGEGENFIEKELSQINNEFSVSLESREIIDNIYKLTSTTSNPLEGII